MGRITDTYTINFKGLKLGKHSFDFDLNDNFFAEFEESEIRRGSLRATLVVERHSRMLDFDISIIGQVQVPCDRCLENIDFPISFEGKLIVKIGEADNEVTDEVIVLPNEDSELNLAAYLYESICLSLPITRYHGVGGTSVDDCNKEMLAELRKHIPHSSNSDNTDSSDPRWAKLRDIKLN